MKKIKLRHILFIALTVLFTLSVIFVSYAAYTHSLQTQRTIAPYDTSERFSSNHLKSGSIASNVKTIYVSEVTESSPNPSTIITICNYPQGRQIQYSTVDITYTFSIEFVYLDNDTYLPVEDSALSGYTASITSTIDNMEIAGTTLSDSTQSTLLKDAANSDIYTLSLSKNFASVKPNLYILVKATPSSNEFSALSAIFKADIRVEGLSNSWSGNFTEANTLTPAAYDGYNYVISGYGSGSFTLTWDTTKINISYISLSELLALDSADYSENQSTHKNTLSFDVDSDLKERYEIQFYKVNIESETWNQMTSEVIVSSFR